MHIVFHPFLEKSSPSYHANVFQFWDGQPEQSGEGSQLWDGLSEQSGEHSQLCEWLSSSQANVHNLVNGCPALRLTFTAL